MDGSALDFEREREREIEEGKPGKGEKREREESKRITREFLGKIWRVRSGVSLAID